MGFGTDDTPGSLVETPDGYDQYGDAWRNCTWFANHRGVDTLGAQPVLHRDGKDFVAYLAGLGYATDGTPRPHDIFSIPAFSHGTGKYGHTGAVLAVKGGQFQAEDYNFVAPLTYGQHWLTTAGISFAHIEHITTSQWWWQGGRS